MRNYVKEKNSNTPKKGFKKYLLGSKFAFKNKDYFCFIYIKLAIFFVYLNTVYLKPFF